MPKGVVYSHRSTILHTLGVASGAPLGHPLSEADTFLPVVPMFHANAWGYPYLATMMGANIVYPGPHLDGESLLDAFEQEKVTWTAGVPTIWLGILAQLDANPGKWDLSALKGMLCGGSAPPRAMIDAYKTRHNLSVVHGWGMTETSPVASVTDLPGRAEGRRVAGAARLHRDAGHPAAVRRAARARRRRQRDPVGRRDDGRARDPRPVGRGRLLQHRRTRPTAGRTTAGS